MTCQNCSALVNTSTPVNGIALCAACDATIVVATGERAADTDINALPDAAVLELRAQRSKNRKARGEPPRRVRG